jgi:hypothetical protein
MGSGFLATPRLNRELAFERVDDGTQAFEV